MKAHSVIVALAAVLFATGANAANADHHAIAERTLKEHIRPGYAALDEAATSLDASSAALCKAPSQPALAKAQGAFKAAVTAWSRVEHIRFGPISDEHRYERFAFWPDHKSIGRRQIAAALAEKDKSVTDPTTLKDKSVALQGLTALEVLLFDDGHDELATPGGAFRCRFGAAIGTNLARMAKAVHEGWAEDAAFPRTFLKPGPNNPVYRQPSEATQEVFKAFTTESEFLKDVKLARTLGEFAKAARGQRAEFWRSGSALQAMTANAEGLTELFTVAFAELVGADVQGLDLALIDALKQVVEVLNATPRPLVDTVHDPDTWNRLHGLLANLNTARNVGARAIAQAADLTIGFNALDGD